MEVMSWKTHGSGPNSNLEREEMNQRNLEKDSKYFLPEKKIFFLCRKSKGIKENKGGLEDGSCDPSTINNTVAALN